MSQERVWKFQLICFAHRVIWRNLQHRASSGTTFDFVNDQLLKFTRWMCIHKEERKRERFLWLFLMIYISSIFSLLILYSFDVLPLKNVFFSSQKVKFEDFACHNSLLQLLMHLLLLLQEVQLSFNRINSLVFRLARLYFSVRGVQYRLDKNQNNKIPEGLLHKLLSDMHRSEFEHFSGHPFNF